MFNVFLFKVQQASSGPQLYKGPVDVVKKLYMQGGIRSIFKGTCATLLRGKFEHIKMLKLLPKMVEKRITITTIIGS